jgi:FkbM family methyltransferase
MFIKEPGTCDWVRNSVKPGEVFYDIGANIGVYTILAAYHAGQKGKVYAFEPHSANFTRLLDNILENNLQNIVVPCNFALNDEHGFFPFNYQSGQAGFSNSQLTSNHNLSDSDDYHEISELKYAASVDSLIASGKFTAPDHIKIDVDGNELLILNGMRDLLGNSKRPISIQVEINKNDKTDISDFMEQYNYILSAKHYTRAALKRRARGVGAEDGIYNAVFRQRT